METLSDLKRHSGIDPNSSFEPREDGYPASGMSGIYPLNVTAQYRNCNAESSLTQFLNQIASRFRLHT